MLNFIFDLNLQKNSPYIEEVNRHLYYLGEMGLFDKWMAESLGNATKCDTLRKKLDSKGDTLTVLSLSHVGSTFALTIIGLLAAAISWNCELGLKKISVRAESLGNATMGNDNLREKETVQDEVDIMVDTIQLG